MLTGYINNAPPLNRQFVLLSVAIIMDLTPPVGIDLNESYQSQLRAKYAATYALAVVAVTLRLLCRLRISKVRLWWDDYIICVALVHIISLDGLHPSIYIGCRDTKKTKRNY